MDVFSPVKLWSYLFFNMFQTIGLGFQEDPEKRNANPIRTRSFVLKDQIRNIQTDQIWPHDVCEPCCMFQRHAFVYRCVACVATTILEHLGRENIKWYILQVVFCRILASCSTSAARESDVSAVASGASKMHHTFSMGARSNTWTLLLCDLACIVYLRIVYCMYV